MEKDRLPVAWLMIANLNGDSVTSVAVHLGQTVKVDDFEAVHLLERGRPLVVVKHAGSGETKDVRPFREAFMAGHFALGITALHPTEEDLNRFSVIAAMLNKRRKQRLASR